MDHKSLNNAKIALPSLTLWGRKPCVFSIRIASRGALRPPAPAPPGTAKMAQNPTPPVVKIEDFLKTGRGASWGPLGGLLGASWALLGASWGPLGGLWAHVGALWGAGGASGAGLGPKCCKFTIGIGLASGPEGFAPGKRKAFPAGQGPRGRPARAELFLYKHEGLCS